MRVHRNAILQRVEDGLADILEGSDEVFEAINHRSI
jgi:hypothetical protein